MKFFSYFFSLCISIVAACFSLSAQQLNAPLLAVPERPSKNHSTVHTLSAPRPYSSLLASLIRSNSPLSVEDYSDAESDEYQTAEELSRRGSRESDAFFSVSDDENEVAQENHHDISLKKNNSLYISDDSMLFDEDSISGNHIFNETESALPESDLLSQKEEQSTLSDAFEDEISRESSSEFSNSEIELSESLLAKIHEMHEAAAEITLASQNQNEEKVSEKVYSPKNREPSSPSLPLTTATTPPLEESLSSALTTGDTAFFVSPQSKKQKRIPPTPVRPEIRSRLSHYYNTFTKGYSPLPRELYDPQIVPLIINVPKEVRKNLLAQFSATLLLEKHRGIVSEEVRKDFLTKLNAPSVPQKSKKGTPALDFLRARRKFMGAKKELEASQQEYQTPTKDLHETAAATPSVAALSDPLSADDNTSQDTSSLRTASPKVNQKHTPPFSFSKTRSSASEKMEHTKKKHNTSPAATLPERKEQARATDTSTTNEEVPAPFSSHVTSVEKKAPSSLLVNKIPFWLTSGSTIASGIAAFYYYFKMNALKKELAKNGIRLQKGAHLPLLFYKEKPVSDEVYKKWLPVIKEIKTYQDRFNWLWKVSLGGGITTALIS